MQKAVCREVKIVFKMYRDKVLTIFITKAVVMKIMKIASSVTLCG